ncbi:hypothetical protein E0Z10_g1878 [Xylaria hypoxylon]|uniref:Aminoglycoside phosphotransferase domain-containing protein n=1 Tax=Xylaria hypoxylon TaxID=37992 RepID=A0A4Z0Z7N1_9PEZI|nr:hypothetical protein E0Z10_g1878 [Xylaria hypoxylon]
MDPMMLPYFCGPEKLPAPLPTISAIEAATETLPSIHPPEYRHTVVVDQYFVVKYGTRMTENEGYALLHLEKHTDISAPRLYAMYREKEKLYLVMDRKPRRQLSELWPSLRDDEKSSISGQLHTIWDKIRSIPSPSTSFSNVTGGPPRHRWFQWLEPDSRIEGPFEKEDLNMALALRSWKNWGGNGRIGWMSEFFVRNLSRTLKNHRACLRTGIYSARIYWSGNFQRPAMGPGSYKSLLY